VCDFNKAAYLQNATPDNIINANYQNHIGQHIGHVVDVKPFKNNLYKVTIYSTHPLSSGDGLKIINQNTKEQVASLGAGNVESFNNNTYIIYTKFKFSAGLEVFLTQNSVAENNLLKNNKKIKINMQIIAHKNKKLIATATNNITSAQIISDEILESAKSRPLEPCDFETQFNKLSNTPFELEEITVLTDGVFIPKSKLNEIRRQLIDKLQSQIIYENEKDIISKFNAEKYNKLCNKLPQTNPKNIVICDDLNFDIKPNTIYVYSPSNYNQINTHEFLNKVKPENFAINIPTITTFKDVNLINQILNTLPKNIYIYANNISALYYANLGYNVISSPLLNIKNSFAIKCLNFLGISTVCASIETSPMFANKYNLIWFQNGKFPLMTFAHCPYKTIHNETCKTCKFNDNLEYLADFKEVYKIKRVKADNCYFELQKYLNNTKANFNLINLTR